MATAMYYSGHDPFTLEPVKTVRSLREKRQMKALVLYWDPQHWPLAREALRQAGRRDLIGNGPGCLIPANDPPGAMVGAPQRSTAQRPAGQHSGSQRPAGQHSGSQRPAGQHSGSQRPPENSSGVSKPGRRPSPAGGHRGGSSPQRGRGPTPGS
jgi:hypothetical protein